MNGQTNINSSADNSNLPRILLLTLVFAPDGVSTSVLMTELAQELQNLGHKVTVLTTTPHYNIDTEARAHQTLRSIWGKLLYQSHYNEIVVYHASVPNKGDRVRTRLMDYLRFHAISTVAGLTLATGYDVILAPSPPLTIGLSGWLLGLVQRVPFIYNVQEIYPDIAVSLGVLQNGLIIRSMEWLERFIYARSRVIVVISERFRRRLLAKGVADQKLCVIPNFVDTKFMQPGERYNDFSNTHNLDKSFVVLYAGNIGLTQGFETILNAAKQLEHIPNLRFVIVGDGARRPWLETQIAQEKLPNISLLPYQPRSVVPQIYASSDLCLVPLKQGTAQGTFPSKIYTIMAAGRPVIASADLDSELAWVVKDANCGWPVPPDNADALAKAIEQAYNNPKSTLQKGNNGRNYVVTHHSLKVVAQQYHQLIQQIVND